MVLQNYVRLQQGVPARLHFYHVEKMVKTITDPLTLKPKSVQSLEFSVDELNGRPAVSTYSIISDKHAQDFAPFLVGEKFKEYDFVITMTGTGFRTEYQVQSIPRTR